MYPGSLFFLHPPIESLGTRLDIDVSSIIVHALWGQEICISGGSRISGGGGGGEGGEVPSAPLVPLPLYYVVCLCSWPKSKNREMCMRGHGPWGPSIILG